MPTGSAAGGGGGGDPCPPANLMPPRDVDAYLEQVALSRSNAVEDGARRPTCRERGSIFGKCGPVAPLMPLTLIACNDRPGDLATLAMAPGEMAHAIARCDAMMRWRLVGTKGCHLGPAQSPKNQRVAEHQYIYL